MTKFEEEELYYDNLLEGIFNLTESEQMVYLARLDEATTKKVMEAMVRKTRKTVRKYKNSLTKISEKAGKITDDSKKAAARDLRKSCIGTVKKIENFEKEDLVQWDLMLRRVDTEANQVTGDELKSIQKDVKAQVNLGEI